MTTFISTTMKDTIESKTGTFVQKVPVSIALRESFLFVSALASTVYCNQGDPYFSRTDKIYLQPLIWKVEPRLLGSTLSFTLDSLSPLASLPPLIPAFLNARGSYVSL